MTNLDCSVTGCFYNEDKCCMKENILVDGKDATENSETCCSSFKEKGCGCNTNTVKNSKKEVDVSCEATNCMFNDACKCQAEHIGIAGGNACNRNETECASFDCK